MKTIYIITNEAAQPDQAAPAPSLASFNPLEFVPVPAFGTEDRAKLFLKAHPARAGWAPRVLPLQLIGATND